jgi:heme/copper-type cytochrome/quinol oxidase subunit 2
MPIPPDLISAGISFLITILILSYLIGDNPLFRAAVYVFVGAAAGYVAAVAIGGAVLGTLFPQISATFNDFDVGLAVTRNTNVVFMILNGAVLLVGVIGTMVYFHFGASQKTDGTVQRNIVVNVLAWVGRVYIAITFGVLFAGVYMAALTALIERMDSMRSFFIQLMQLL